MIIEIVWYSTSVQSNDDCYTHEYFPFTRIPSSIDALDISKYSTFDNRNTLLQRVCAVYAIISFFFAITSGLVITLRAS